MNTEMIGRLFTLALMVAGMVTLGRIATAQTVMMPDGRAVRFEQVPVVEKFRGALTLPTMMGGSYPVTVMSTPAFCPSAWARSIAFDGISNSEAACTRQSQIRLEDYPASVRERCQCVRVIEGPSLVSLKAVSDIVNDPYVYTVITLVVTRQNTREKLRGFVGRTAAGVYRIFNEKGRLVCAPLDPAGTDRTAFTCFDGRVNAKGTYRVISAQTSISNNYGLGTFQLSDGSQLDMAVAITDRDLFARHPDFPH